jgi:hypothetical protein
MILSVKSGRDAEIKMIGELTNHPWQLMVLAFVAALLKITLARNWAQARHWLWLTARMRIYAPFALLMGVGRRRWVVQAAGKITEFTAPPVSQAKV